MKGNEMIELNRTECRALRRAWSDFEDDFASERAGKKTLARLVALGFMEKGPDNMFGETFRTTEAGKVAFRSNVDRHGSIERHDRR